MYLKCRRGIDIIFSLFLLLALFWPLLLLFLIQLFLLNENPLFCQLRIGKDEKTFTLYKFKTMKGEQLPNRFSVWLRISGLDELPQLLNILLGDMSFIGPRPLLPEYLSLYNEKQKTRHSVLPGITGLAQVNGGNSLNWKERLEFDVLYVKSVSFSTDVKVLVLTALLPFKNKENKHFSDKFTGN
jgi:undecaprenyl phosphate N,N'-diacetylbacillosamine 1-phosphate transferase